MCFWVNILVIVVVDSFSTKWIFKAQSGNEGRGELMS